MRKMRFFTYKKFFKINDFFVDLRARFVYKLRTESVQS
jgi:hypothetical protein